jgi:hypothetical protein
MREAILLERLLRLEKFLTKLEHKNPPPHLAKRWAKTLLDLYLGLLRAEDANWPNSQISLGDAFKQSSGSWLQMYVHTPVQKRVNAALKKWEEGYPEIARKMFEELASDQCGQKIGSEIQSGNASHKHKKGAYEKLLEDLVKEKPDIGHKEMERELRRQVGKGVIKHIDDSLGEIILEDGRDFKLSGLKDKIYKIRIKI